MKKQDNLHDDKLTTFPLSKKNKKQQVRNGQVLSSKFPFSFGVCSLLEQQLDLIFKKQVQIKSTKV